MAAPDTSQFLRRIRWTGDTGLIYRFNLVNKNENYENYVAVSRENYIKIIKLSALLTLPDTMALVLEQMPSRVEVTKDAGSTDIKIIFLKQGVGKYTAILDSRTLAILKENETLVMSLDKGEVYEVPVMNIKKEEQMDDSESEAIHSGAP